MLVSLTGSMKRPALLALITSRGWRVSVVALPDTRG